MHDKGAARITGAKINFLINVIYFNKWAKDKIRSIPCFIYKNKLQIGQES